MACVGWYGVPSERYSLVYVSILAIEIGFSASYCKMQLERKEVTIDMVELKGKGLECRLYRLVYLRVITNVCDENVC